MGHKFWNLTETRDLPHRTSDPSWPRSNVRVEDRRGWPFHAGWFGWSLRITTDANGHPAPELEIVDGAVIGPPAAPSAAVIPDLLGVRVIPLRPLAGGTAADTAFHAVIWCVAWYGLAGAKRMARRCRGRCLRCGYDLGGDYAGGCPECGWGRHVKVR